jgi:hypothetical protein
MKQRE